MNSRYDNNAVETQSKYSLDYALSSSSPSSSFNRWLVDSGASKHFTGYREVLSNLVERDSDLKIILGDNCTYHVKGCKSISFHLNYG